MERVRVATGIIGIFSVTSVLLVAQFAALGGFAAMT
jgi:hypothetical protein